jgi:hypothetical protein
MRHLGELCRRRAQISRIFLDAYARYAGPHDCADRVNNREAPPAQLLYFLATRSVAQGSFPKSSHIVKCPILSISCSNLNFQK